MPSSTPAPVHSRAMSAMDHWLHASPRGLAHVVQLVFEGDGSIEEPALAAALEAAGHACPGSRLRRRGRAWTDAGVAPAVRATDAAGFDRARLDSPLLRSPLTGDRAPACEVLLVLGTPSTLVFRAHHGVMDGQGVLLWAAQVFRALRGEPLEPAVDVLNDQELIERIAADQEIELPELAPPPPLEWSGALGALPAGPRAVLWRRRAVDGVRPGALARLAQALSAARADGRGRFTVPVDLRRHDPGLRSTGALVETILLDVEPGEEWNEVQARLLTRLAAGADLAARIDPGLLRLPLPLLRLMVRAADRKATRTGLYGALACLSHLGTVDLAEYSGGGFEAVACYSLGGAGAVTPPELNIVESGGRTDITLAWRDGPGVAERAEALLDLAEEALAPRARRSRLTSALPVPDGRLVVEMFRDQVRRTPWGTALSDAEGSTGYLELSRQADAVASGLRARGVGRGDVVGLLADRSPAGIAGLWGVLRAGAAYLPLDAKHPDGRLAGILADAGARCCLVEEHHRDRDWCPPGCEPVPLGKFVEAGSADEAELRSAGEEALAGEDADIRPEDLAYVIYTSGSTGKPKGVQVTHGNLVNYVHWATRVFGVTGDTRLPLVTSPSFDVTGTSVFLPLLAGGCTVLMRDEPSHLSLRTLLEESDANALSLTPAHLDLIGRLDLRPRGFRTVVVVGEQLRVPIADRAQEMFGPGCRIVNLYGPTEATIGCTAHVYDPVADGARAAVPIGLPADNTGVLLLDEARRHVAPGEPGEMYLGGAQLARGYLGRPDLDRVRFVTLADGARYYRTGDLARLNEDGELEFLARIDDQVKIHGHRVEPAEVATALEQHPAVVRAAVVARRLPGHSGNSLFGYVLTREPADPEELRAFLTSHLPAYLVPAAVVVLDELPLTVAGKIDTRALPDPVAAPVCEERDDEEALDAVEAAVAGIWATTLDLAGVRSAQGHNFFRLGGNSLMFYAMLAAVCRDVVGADGEAAFMAELPQLVRDPTLRRVADATRRASGTRG